MEDACKTSDDEISRKLASADFNDRIAGVEMLYIKYNRFLMSFLNKEEVDHAVAEDFVEGTFAKLIDQLRSKPFRSDYSLKTIIGKIARGLCIDHFRKIRKRETELHEGAAEKLLATDDDHPDELLKAKDIYALWSEFTLTLDARKQQVATYWGDNCEAGMRHDEMAKEFNQRFQDTINPQPSRTSSVGSELYSESS